MHFLFGSGYAGLGTTDPLGLDGMQRPSCGQSYTCWSNYGQSVQWAHQGGVNQGPASSWGVPDDLQLLTVPTSNAGTKYDGSKCLLCSPFVVTDLQNPFMSPQFPAPQNPITPLTQGANPANNGKTTAQCVGVALKKNAASLTLDGAGIAAGFLPGGGDVSILGNLASWGTQTGLGFASFSNSFYHGNDKAGFLGMASSTLPTLAQISAGVSVAGAKANSRIRDRGKCRIIRLRRLADISRLPSVYTTSMKNLSAGQTFGGLTPLWALIAVSCASPLFFLFALQGDPGRGRAAMFSAAVIILAIRSRWDLSQHIWFWTTVAAIVGLHVPLVLLTHWPEASYPGFTLLLPAALDYAAIYGLMKVVERAMTGSQLR